MIAGGPRNRSRFSDLPSPSLDNSFLSLSPLDKPAAADPAARSLVSHDADPRILLAR